MDPNPYEPPQDIALEVVQPLPNAGETWQTLTAVLAVLLLVILSALAMGWLVDRYVASPQR